MSTKVLSRADFPSLFDTLEQLGYVVIGPTVGDGAIVYGPIEGVDDLPVGWTDEQGAGEYRLRRRDDDALFGHAVGPQSWKRYLFPPTESLVEVRRVDGSLAFGAPRSEPPRYAFVGVRACELAAIAVQDGVFLQPGFADPTYATVRDGALIVAVNCVVAGGTCFCVSMGTGPECTDGYDIVVTEIIDDGRHDFVVASGSETGEQILSDLSGRDATEVDYEAVSAAMTQTAQSMGREIDVEDLGDVLQANAEHPHWEDVAQRCLACANCTLVCPTCFCWTVDDTVALDGGPARRSRRWDSCFSLEFSGLHGVPVRSSTKARYRQWITHKLSTWWDQFGTSGCVGCGRCITWCPVGIDITVEAAAIAESREVAIC